MTRSGQLDADGVRALFQELSDRLADAGVTAQLFVVGGAAMALAYDRDRLTRDVDALFVPAPEVRRIAAEMSGPQGLEPDWLNDAAKGLLPGADEHPRTVVESESLLVQQECIDLLTATYPATQLLPRHRYLAEDVITRAHAKREVPMTTDTAKRRR